MNFYLALEICTLNIRKMKQFKDVNAMCIYNWFQGKKSLPLNIEVYPTNKCNLKCIFCGTQMYQYPTKKELPDEKWFSIIKEANSLDKETFGLTKIYILGGGEPFVRIKLFKAILKRIRKQAFFSVTTNATLLDDEVIYDLVKFGWDEIVISLDGTDEVHDFHRNKKGVFSKVIKTLSRIEECKKRYHSELPIIKLHTVLTDYNFDKLNPLIDLAERYKVHYLELDSLCVAPYFLDLDIKPEHLETFQNLLKNEYLPRLKKFGIKNNYSNFVESHEIIKKDNPQKGNKLKSPINPLIKKALKTYCFYPWTRLVINAYGEVRVCCVGEGEEDSGRLLSTIKETWFNSPYLNKIRKDMMSGKPRNYCRYCPPGLIGENLRIKKIFRKCSL